MHKLTTTQFLKLFDTDKGVDTDALWINMNEAANFNFLTVDVEETAEERNMPPPPQKVRSQPRQIEGVPQEFQANFSSPYPPGSLAYALSGLTADAAPNKKKKHADMSKSSSKKRCTGPSQP